MSGKELKKKSRFSRAAGNELLQANWKSAGESAIADGLSYGVRKNTKKT
jgi:hypothetical protein